MSLTPRARQRRETARRLGNDSHVDDDCCFKCCSDTAAVCMEKCDCSKCSKKKQTKVYPLSAPTVNVMKRGGRRTRKKRKRRSMCARLTNKACKTKRYKKRCKTTRRKKRGSKGRKSHCRTRKNRFAKRPNRKKKKRR